MAFNEKAAAFKNEVWKETRAWAFQLFALSLLICIVIFSTRVILKSTPCGDCPEQAKPTTQSASQPVETDASKRAAEQLIREREGRLRADAEDRGWAHFLTTVTGAIIGYLFGSSTNSTARGPSRATDSDSATGTAPTGTPPNGFPLDPDKSVQENINIVHALSHDERVSVLKKVGSELSKLAAKQIKEAGWAAMSWKVLWAFPDLVKTLFPDEEQRKLRKLRDEVE